ncbi:MAG TPA: hypothetical protein PK402_09440 [Tepidisphaeraceae bacterium]|nr:hypothetical protein [Tepidisphaeraceae bacterium]
MVLIRYLWALPTTLVGFPFVILALMTGGGCRVVRGVIEVHGGAVAWLLEHATMLEGGATAMTIGHIVLARSRAAHDVTREHERIHVRQVERWGPLFLPAYFISSIIAWKKGLDPYRDNRFEIEAYDDDARRAHEN